MTREAFEKVVKEEAGRLSSVLRPGGLGFCGKRFGHSGTCGTVCV